MEITEQMSMEELLSIVLDEDDIYGWATRIEARDCALRKFKNSQQSVQANDDEVLGCPDCSSPYPSGDLEAHFLGCPRGKNQFESKDNV